jgi:L-threonylcarbamoyladenylate synthase
LPDYPDLLKLIDTVGPLVSTSANLQGSKPAANVKEAQKIFGERLNFYVDTGQLANPPSTLAVARNGHLEIQRLGAVKIDNKE